MCDVILNEYISSKLVLFALSQDSDPNKPPYTHFYTYEMSKFIFPSPKYSGISILHVTSNITGNELKNLLRTPHPQSYENF